MTGLSDRVAIITGAGRGIGRAHALLFAELGAHVVVNDLGVDVDGNGTDAGPAQTVVAEIEARGGSAIASTDDVSSFGGAERAVAAAVDTFGDLHVVVNNAGISREEPLVSTPERDFDDIVAVNLKGTFNMSHHAAAFWKQQSDSGRSGDRAIVNTSSGAGLHGSGSGIVYAATKAAVAAMTMVSATELAPHGVRTNCIAPIARTRLTGRVPGLNDIFAPSVFDPEHISTLVSVLAAPDCPFNGQIFSVCGPSVGIYAGWSITDEVVADERWTFDSLGTALRDLEAPIVTGQGEIVAGLMAPME